MATTLAASSSVTNGRSSNVMRLRQIGQQVTVRFAGLNSRQRFAERRDSWQIIDSRHLSASVFDIRASDSNLPMAIAAEKADLRTAEQSRDTRSQDVPGKKKPDNTEEDEKRHIRIRPREQ